MKQKLRAFCHSWPFIASEPFQGLDEKLRKFNEIVEKMLIDDKILLLLDSSDR